MSRRLHSSHHLDDHSELRILSLLRQAEFDLAEKVTTGRMLFGLLHTRYYRACVMDAA